MLIVNNIINFVKENDSDIRDIMYYSFQYILVAYLLLLLIEQIKQGAISLFFNLNYLLAIVIVIGILTVLFPLKRIEEEKKISWKDHVFISTLGVAGTIIIFIKTRQLGWLSYLISVIAGILIVLLSLLVLEEKGGEEEKEIEENKNEVK